MNIWTLSFGLAIPPTLFLILNYLNRDNPQFHISSPKIRAGMIGWIIGVLLCGLVTWLANII